jgi:hypothetical protein
MAEIMTRTSAPHTNVGELLALTGPGAHLILLLYVVTQVTLAVTGGGDPMRTWQGVAALVLVLLAAVLTVRPGRYPLRLSRTIVIVLVVVVSTLVISWQLKTDGSWPGYSAWYIGADTFLMLALGLRGRYGWAWVGMGLMIALTVLWSTFTNQGPLHGLDLVAREAGLLLIGTLFAIGLDRTARRILELNQAETTKVSEGEAVRAASQERNRQVDRLEQVAGVALATIANGEPRTPTSQADYLALEATLRDSIRARTFAIEPLTSSARRARQSGIDVLLLDDMGSAEIPEDRRQSIVEWVTGLLEETHRGTFTARLRRTPQGFLATVVSTDRGDRYEFAVDTTEELSAL